MHKRDQEKTTNRRVMCVGTATLLGLGDLSFSELVKERISARMPRNRLIVTVLLLAILGQGVGVLPAMAEEPVHAENEAQQEQSSMCGKSCCITHVLCIHCAAGACQAGVVAMSTTPAIFRWARQPHLREMLVRLPASSPSRIYRPPRIFPV
jgi:hypothetical protein